MHEDNAFNTHSHSRWMVRMARDKGIKNERIQVHPDPETNQIHGELKMKWDQVGERIQPTGCYNGVQTLLALSTFLGPSSGAITTTSSSLPRLLMWGTVNTDSSGLFTLEEVLCSRPPRGQSITKQCSSSSSSSSS